MAESIKPFDEDFSTSIEDLAEFSGEIALEIYRQELEKGSSASLAFSAMVSKQNDDGFWMSVWICIYLLTLQLMVLSHL